MVQRQLSEERVVFFFFFFNLLLAALGHHRAQALSSYSKWVAVRGLLIVVASLVAEHRL